MTERDGVRDDMDPEDGDPAAAFDALRRAVEGGQVALTREIAQVVRQLGLAAERLESIEKLPVLRQGADHYARVLERSGTELVSGAARKLEASTSGLDRAVQELTTHVASARASRRQNKLVFGVGAAGCVLGVLLTLFAPRILPGAIDVTVASTVMGRTPWRAGMALMEYDSPAGWGGIVADHQLAETNRDVVNACRDTAEKSGKEQKCTIRVEAQKP